MIPAHNTSEIGIPYEIPFANDFATIISLVETQRILLHFPRQN